MGNNNKTQSRLTKLHTKNKTPKPASIYSLLCFYYRDEMLLSQWKRWHFSFTSKITVIFADHILPQKHMMEGVSNTAFWSVCYCILINFFGNHLKTANLFTFCSFIIKFKLHLIYLTKHRGNSTNDKTAQFGTKEALPLAPLEISRNLPVLWNHPSMHWS